MYIWWQKNGGWLCSDGPHIFICSFMCTHHIDMTAHTQSLHESGVPSVSTGIWTYAAQVLARHGNHLVTEAIHFQPMSNSLSHAHFRESIAPPCVIHGYFGLVRGQAQVIAIGFIFTPLLSNTKLCSSIEMKVNPIWVSDVKYLF